MVAVLHSLSSQKHIFPLPPPSDIQTWSTMNMLMSRFSVQLRRTFQSAKRNDENIRFLRINLANKCGSLVLDAEEDGCNSRATFLPFPTFRQQKNVL